MLWISGQKTFIVNTCMPRINEKKFERFVALAVSHQARRVQSYSKFSNKTNTVRCGMLMGYVRFS